MSVPTSGETYAKLMYHLTEAQECCAMMSHLEGLNDKSDRAKGWLSIEEHFKRMLKVVTGLAKGSLQ
jgi:hypothetical protein